LRAAHGSRRATAPGRRSNAAASAATARAGCWRSNCVPAVAARSSAITATSSNRSYTRPLATSVIAYRLQPEWPTGMSNAIGAPAPSRSRSDTVAMLIGAVLPPAMPRPVSACS